MTVWICFRERSELAADTDTVCVVASRDEAEAWVVDQKVRSAKYQDGLFARYYFEEHEVKGYGNEVTGFGTCRKAS